MTARFPLGDNMTIHNNEENARPRNYFVEADLFWPVRIAQFLFLDLGPQLQLVPG